MAAQSLIDSVNYNRNYYSLDRACGLTQNGDPNDNTYREIAMDHPMAACWKPVTAAITPRGPLADKIRFAAGIAITLGGAGVFLSDLIYLIPFG